ncbi:peroxisomal leader peptide-processing protease isoform X1 [Paramormyrops kingsleyae]|uniref:peroxisomal leader peptide-processing protease isoform X1 n=1 Tax=Paramormyrops kingsleyae TaxID=1676925 RepID=UPI003B973289
MVGIAETCCVVTAFESSEKHVGEQSDYSKVHKQFSCSGVILNESHGLVLCSGHLFSRFLIRKDVLSTDFQFLLRGSFSDTLTIYVQHDYTTHPSNAITCRGRTTNPEQNRLKLTHLKAEFIVLINCLEFQTAFLELFKVSDNWRFSLGEEHADLIKDSDFLSYFALLRVPGLVKSAGKDTVHWVSSCALEKGCEVFACGSPFGSVCPDLFMNTLSKGIVSNVVGKDNSVILTDSHCLPGTEGGGLFVKEGDAAFLVGLIVSPFCWKSREWVGLTLVCSFHLILQNLAQAVNHRQSLNKLSIEVPVDVNQALLHKGLCAIIQNFPMVCLVDSNQFWGSGVLLNSQLVLTCRHVLNGKSRVVVRYKTSKRLLSVMGDVLFATKVTAPFDVAIVWLQEPLPDIIVPKLASSFKPGKSVCIIGYGVFGHSCGHSVTSGILSKVVTCQSQAAMLQTTCAVQAGASGGALVQTDTGELLGLVCSNTRDFAADVTYPHLNFCIPMSVLAPLLRAFSVTHDPTIFQKLDDAGPEVARVWRLQIRPQRHQASRL